MRTPDSPSFLTNKWSYAGDPITRQAESCRAGATGANRQRGAAETPSALDSCPASQWTMSGRSFRRADGSPEPIFRGHQASNSGPSSSHAHVTEPQESGETRPESPHPQDGDKALLCSHHAPSGGNRIIARKIFSQINYARPFIILIISTMVSKFCYFEEKERKILVYTNPKPLCFSS